MGILNVTPDSFSDGGRFAGPAEAVRHAERLVDALRALDLPTGIPPGLDPDALLARMRLDKKNLSGTLRLILWRGIGRAFVATGIDEAAVRAALASR